MPKTQLHSRVLSPKSLLGLLVALIVAFLLLLSVITVAQKYLGIRGHIKALHAEKSQLETKYDDLSRRNEYLDTPEGTERILREKYNVIRPGEGVVVVVDPRDAVMPSSSPRELHWWQKLLAGLGMGKK